MGSLEVLDWNESNGQGRIGVKDFEGSLKEKDVEEGRRIGRGCSIICTRQEDGYSSPNAHLTWICMFPTTLI